MGNRSRLLCLTHRLSPRQIPIPFTRPAIMASSRKSRPLEPAAPLPAGEATAALQGGAFAEADPVAAR